jgi:hypothetical protein
MFLSLLFKRSLSVNSINGATPRGLQNAFESHTTYKSPSKHRSFTMAQSTTPPESRTSSTEITFNAARGQASDSTSRHCVFASVSPPLAITSSGIRGDTPRSSFNGVSGTSLPPTLAINTKSEELQASSEPKETAQSEETPKSNEPTGDARDWCDIPCEFCD